MEKYLVANLMFNKKNGLGTRKIILLIELQFKFYSVLIITLRCKYQFKKGQFHVLKVWLISFSVIA